MVGVRRLRNQPLPLPPAPSRNVAPMSSSSRTVRARNWCSGFWKMHPMRLASSSDVHPPGLVPSPRATVASASTVPAIGFSNPARVRPRVVLPAPLGPVITVEQPRGRCNVRGSPTGVWESQPTLSCVAWRADCESPTPGSGSIGTSMPGTHTPTSARRCP